MTQSIELPENSLYGNGIISSFPDGEVLERDAVKWTPANDDRVHTVVDGDRLDELAWHFYGNKVEDASKYWWVIADANSIEDPTDLSSYIGSDIVIPNINKFILLI